MTITVPELEGFNRMVWDTTATSLRTTASLSDAQAQSLRNMAAAVRQAWRDDIGAMIAQRCEEQADDVERFGAAAPGLADILTRAADQMVKLQAQLASVLAVAASNDLVVSDSGNARPRLGVILTDPIRALKLRSLANAVSAHVKALLQAATVVDRTAATALAAALGLKVDDFDLGPLDLSPEGLQDQAFNTSQGSVGFCAWLTPLMSMSSSHPEHLAEHMVWDPVTQTYEVTLYDPETGEKVVTNVDPRTLGPTFGDPSEAVPRHTYTDDPTYLSIYSQALRQAYPDITSSNFELTAKIVLGPGNYVETQAANTSFDSIRQTLEADPPGAVMVATTNAPEQQPDNMPDDKKLQGGHAYSVTGFTPDGRIILKNPHGPGAADHTIMLTEDEYQRWLNGVMQIPGE